jgi:predicted amidophosphoribosyltransferase
MSFEQSRSPTSTHAAAHSAGRLCPFCGAPVHTAQLCAACGRDTTAPRRPCEKCGQMIPSHERACWRCGASFKSELWWKVPLIVLLFLLAFVISAVLALLK